MTNDMIDPNSDLPGRPWGDFYVSPSTTGTPGYLTSPSTWPQDGWYVAVICPRCGRNHRLDRCPQVRAIEYHPDGYTIKRVEFFDGTGARPLGADVTVTATGVVVSSTGLGVPYASTEEEE